MSQPRQICRPTGKRRYATATQAGDALFFANRGYHLNPAFEIPSNVKRPQRMYVCPACGDWHLTSHIGRAAA